MTDSEIVDLVIEVERLSAASVEVHNRHVLASNAPEMRAAKRVYQALDSDDPGYIDAYHAWESLVLSDPVAGPAWTDWKLVNGAHQAAAERLSAAIADRVARTAESRAA